MPYNLIWLVKSIQVRNICIILFLISSCGLKAQLSKKNSLISQIKHLRNQNPNNLQNTAYVDLLNELSNLYRYRKADSIKMLSDEALVISSNINYRKGKALALLRRGDYYSDTNQEIKAFEVYNEAKELTLLLNFPELNVQVLKSIAYQEFLSQNLNNAVLTYYEAIDLASKNNLYELEARLRHNLGYSYYSYKLFDEAHTEYVVADSLWDKVGGDNHFKAMTISNIALNAIDKGDLDLGNAYNEKSIDILKKRNEPLWLSRAFRVKARYFVKKRNSKKLEIGLENLKVC